jgi:hypothetical protein
MANYLGLLVRDTLGDAGIIPSQGPPRQSAPESLTETTSMIFADSNICYFTQP